MTKLAKPKTTSKPTSKSKSTNPSNEKPRPSAGDPTLQIAHPTSAGIDVHSREHWVCVPASLATTRPDDHPANLPSNIRSFGTCTRDLERLADGLTACGITTVAHKIAGRVYRLLKHGEKYVRQEIAAYEALFQLKQTKNLAKKATELGYLLIPVPPPSDRRVRSPHGQSRLTPAHHSRGKGGVVPSTPKSPPQILIGYDDAFRTSLGGPKPLCKSFVIATREEFLWCQNPLGHPMLHPDLTPTFTSA